MPLQTPTNESNDIESYRTLEEVRRYSNKDFKVNRELIERAIDPKEFTTVGKLKAFQFVSGVLGRSYSLFMDEEARDAYFDLKQLIVLDFWVERRKEIGMLTVIQQRLGVILEERLLKPSVPELKGQVSFECGSWDGPLKASLVVRELMKPSWCPHPNSCLIWDVTADVVLELDDDGSLHNLALIHRLLALKIMKQDDRPPMEPSKRNSPSDWTKKGTCLASGCGMEEHVGGIDHCLHKLSEQHCQLAKLYVRLSMSDKSEMEKIAGCRGATEVNLMTTLGFYSMVSSIESLSAWGVPAS